MSIFNKEPSYTRKEVESLLNTALNAQISNVERLSEKYVPYIPLFKALLQHHSNSLKKLFSLPTENFDDK